MFLRKTFFYINLWSTFQHYVLFNGKFKIIMVIDYMIQQVQFMLDNVHKVRPNTPKN